MRYVSTRGQAAPADFAEVLLAGLAPDGGLYVPEEWPTFSPDRDRRLRGPPLCRRRRRGDRRASPATPSPPDQLRRDRRRRLRHLRPPRRGAAEAARRRPVAAGAVPRPHAGLQGRGHAAALAAVRRRAGGARRTLTIVCATSGDTGGAAVEAFRGARHARIVVLFPDGSISEVQRRFMTTTRDENVRVVAVDGTFDDCQALVKAAVRRRSLQARRRPLRRQLDQLGAGRGADGLLRHRRRGARRAGAAGAFVVPTGNFGDAFAGYVAHAHGAADDAPSRRHQRQRHPGRAPWRPAATPAARSSPPRARPWTSRSPPTFERLYFEALAPRRGGDRARLQGLRRRRAPSTCRPQPLAYMRDGFTGQAASEAETARHHVHLNETRRAGGPPHRRRPRRRPARTARRRGDATGGAGHRPSRQVPRRRARRHRRRPAAARPCARPARSARSASTALPADVDAVKAYVRRFVAG